MEAPVFVVGTGRCGSTLISNMLRQHKHVLSVSELFSFITDLGSVIPPAFPEGSISGQEFWKIIGTKYPKQNTMLRHDVAMNEVLYPKCRQTSFQYDTGVPAILQVTLPHLCSDFDATYEDLKDHILRRPIRSMRQHYLDLFQWLGQRVNRGTFVERSGGSLRILHRLFDSFPHAKFVHIVRDGRNCSISMSRHRGFRMALSIYQFIEVLGVDPYLSDDREWVDDLPDDLVSLLPENFTAQAFRDYRVAPSLCGHYWSGEIQQGLKTVAKIPSAQLLQIRYEDFLQQPGQAIETLIRFIGNHLHDQAWISRCKNMVKMPKSSWCALPLREQEWLESSCAPGFAALAEMGLRW